MKTLRLRVLDSSGQGNPSIGAAARRNLWIRLAAFCAMVSVSPRIYVVPGNADQPILAAPLTLVIWLSIGITIATSPIRQGIHDHFAGGTSVVRRSAESADTP